MSVCHSASSPEYRGLMVKKMKQILSFQFCSTFLFFLKLIVAVDSCGLMICMQENIMDSIKNEPKRKHYHAFHTYKQIFYFLEVVPQ